MQTIYFDQTHPSLLPFQLLSPLILDSHVLFLKSQVPLCCQCVHGFGAPVPYHRGTLTGLQCGYVLWLLDTDLYGHISPLIEELSH